MRLLLDTHTLLWWLSDPPLETTARDHIADHGNPVFVSAATAWEITVKQALGKLTAPDDLESVVASGGFEALPISFAHGLTAGRLPPHHRDPFDRILIAQAQHEGLAVVTRDSVFAAYDVATVAA